MKKLVSHSVMIIAIFSTGACTFNNVYINRVKDDSEGKVFLKKFYSNVINGDYEGVDSMTGDSLKQLVGVNGVSKLIKFINSKVGKCKSYTIDDHYIRCTTGSNNETSYNYKLKVIYDKGTIDEVIGFKKQNGSEIKINSYHANSDLLMH